MTKKMHEIRDPLHVFIRLDSDERKVLNSHPFQRLRYIHQLGLTYLLYTGATHRRFEHSLGEACKKFGEANVRYDTYKQKGSGLNFPVLIDGRIASSLAMSEALKNVPFVAVDYVFINPDYRKEAEKWLKDKRESIIIKKEEEKI
jgi:hypothetical protein